MLNTARLGELFGSEQRFRVLREVYLNPARWFTCKELWTRTGVDQAHAFRLMSRWAKLGLVDRKNEGRTSLYRASGDPLLQGLTDIILRNDAILDDIRAALPDATDAAVIFGSMARGEERGDSDIDVLVLGDELSSIRVNAALALVGRKHMREINASVHSRNEFEDLLADQDSFALGVVENKVINLKGEFAYVIAQSTPGSAG